MKEYSFAKLARQIKAKWRQLDPSLYWGDNLDVRYYLCFKLKHVKGKKVLDIGCGPGIVLSELDDSNDKIGLDISQVNLQVAKEFNPQGNFLVSDMHKLPFKKEVFDVILLNAMLPLSLNKQELIADIWALLKPKGLFYLTTHNRKYYEYNRESTMSTIAQIGSYLKPYFEYKISGFNFLPRFPFFLPNMLVDKIPFIWNFIKYSSEHNMFSDISCGIYAEAIKK